MKTFSSNYEKFWGKTVSHTLDVSTHNGVENGSDLLAQGANANDKDPVN